MTWWGDFAVWFLCSEVSAVKNAWKAEVLELNLNLYNAYFFKVTVFSHNGGQGCVLQGSSSGTGLAAESHLLSGTSSSVWRSIHRMTLC